MLKRMIGLGLLLLTSTATAQEPKKEAKLPAPRPLVIELVPIRENRYDVWQNYGVDRYGRFRSRVILGPYGAYYRQTGQPYPWWPSHPLDFMPYTVD
jgi:hypothetical protein